MGAPQQKKRMHSNNNGWHPQKDHKKDHKKGNKKNIRSSCCLTIKKTPKKYNYLNLAK